MANKLLKGVWRYLVGVPPFLWEKQIAKAKKKIQESTRFMSPDHRRIHHYTVRELPTIQKPISAEKVSEDLTVPLDRVKTILQDLEKHLTFLWRNNQGEVVWAYPVTVEKTPHLLTFDSGEQIYAA